LSKSVKFDAAAWREKRNREMYERAVEHITNAQKYAKSFSASELRKHTHSRRVIPAEHCSKCSCPCVYGLALCIKDGYRLSVSETDQKIIFEKFESEECYMNDHCEHYKGTEKISATETMIKCPMLPEGGKVFNNKDDEGKELISKCWHHGTDCPYLNVEQTAEPACDAVQQEFSAENYGDSQVTLENAVEPADDAEPQALTEIATDDNQVTIKAATLHHRILVNSQIAAQSIVAIAKDLKTMKDEKLYTALGCADFNEYCESRVGIKQRQAYNFLRVLDKYGEKQLDEVSHLGIAKLVELTSLDDEDRQELIDSGRAEEMSVRELKEEIARLNSRCEQLTLDIEDERDKVRTLNDNSEVAALETQLEELKGLLAAASQEKDSIEDRYSKQKAALIEEHRKEKQYLKNELAELKETKETNAFLTEEISKLRKRKEEGANEISEEDMERLREEGRTQANKDSEKRYNKALKEAKAKADDERIIAVDTARKQEAEKYAAEIEKLKAENAALQSNAHKPAPTEQKALFKFHLKNLQDEFNGALELLASFEDDDKKKLTEALKTILATLEEAVSDV